MQRTLRLPSPAASLVSRVGWLAVLALSALVVVNSLPYFTAGTAIDFLAERPVLTASPVWRAALLHHVAGALVCLVVGPVLLSARLLRASPAAHRVLGWTYVVAVTCVAAPSGLALSITAKGGLAGQLGFAVLGVAWLATTLAGVRAIRQRRLSDHVTWMARSAAIASSALSFRVVQVALYAVGVPDHPNYVASLWSSLALSVVLGEWGAARLRSRVPHPRSRSRSQIQSQGVLR